MKSLNLTLTQFGGRVVAVAVMSSNEDGNDAVPLFGIEAIRATLRYLEVYADDSLAGAVEITRMLQGGKTYEELKRDSAERAAQKIAAELERELMGRMPPC